MGNDVKNLWVDTSALTGLQQKVDDDICSVFMRWADNEAPYFTEASDLFADLVRPAVMLQANPTMADLIEMNLSFTEWFLFEYPLLHGLTPVELCAGEGPIGEDWAGSASLGEGMRCELSTSRFSLRGVLHYANSPSGSSPYGAEDGDGASSADRAIRLSQVADTQRFSQFCIKGVGADGLVKLRDLVYGEEIELRQADIASTPEWRHCIFGLRVAKVDGTWLQVGKSCFCDKAPDAELGQGTTPSPARVRPDTGSLFLDLLRETIGIDGFYTPEARVVA